METAATTPGRHNNRIHSKKVRIRLKEVGLNARRPYFLDKSNAEKMSEQNELVATTQPSSVFYVAMETNSV